MTDKEARLKICSGLSTIYGINEGLRMAGIVVPGIINDFEEMVKKAAEGTIVKEEYRLEDGRAVIFISGKGIRNGSIYYENVRVVSSPY